MPPLKSTGGTIGGAMAKRHEPPTILAAKHYAAPSVFQPENLLREARRQLSLADATVPAVCVLDPDGDMVRALRASGRSRRAASWACAVPAALSGGSLAERNAPPAFASVAP